MKKILHFQIPTNEHGYPVMSNDFLGQLCCSIGDQIDEKQYDVVFSPFILQSIDGVNIRLDHTLTLEEVLRLAGKNTGKRGTVDGQN